MTLVMANPFYRPKSSPRVGVPWRTAIEEREGKFGKIENYLRAIEQAGGKWELISLSKPPTELARLAATLDAFVLPGSPADVDPTRYGAQRHPQCAEPDPLREQTDYTLLDHAVAAEKPVLAICYGTQLLNVYLGGTLIQDIPSQLKTQIRHDKNGLPAGSEDPYHAVRLEAGSKLAGLAGAAEARVNSSHHQAILSSGRDLLITARAPDGVIEAVEWAGGSKRILGVQWHPERMAGNSFAAALFRELVATARGVVVQS